MKKTLILIVLLFAQWITLTAHDPQTEKPSLIQELADLNIQSTPWDDGEWWDEEDFATFLKKYLHSLENPHPRLKRVNSFKLLKQVDWVGTGCMLNDTTIWHDLDLFSGRNKKSEYVAARLDRTTTELGKTALYALLAHPTSDEALIKQRQTVISSLLENQELFDELNKSLVKFASSESLVVTLFNQNVLKNASKHCYFQNILSPANESSVALQARSIFDHVMRSYGTLSGGIATLVLFAYGISQLTSTQDPWLDQQAQDYKSDAGYVFRAVWPLLTHPILRGLLALGGSALCAGACYENVKWEHACTVLEVMLQSITMRIAQLMNAVLEISHQLERHPELAENPDFKPLFNLQKLVNEKSEDVAELFELLSSDTLQGEPSIFSLHGRSLRAFKLFDELKESFIPAFVATAKLDAYMSCARLIKESEDKRVKFTFAQFTEDQTPSIQATGLWHPFISPEHVVAHDYALGIQQAARTMIITGPNEGGKSTILKEVALALVMAQSLGIVPAQEFIATPFATIATYLTVTDDTASGDSLFRASAIRAGQLLDKIEAAKEGEFVFAAFDELFSGTSPEEGEAAAYSVVKGIGQSPYVISLVATHFPLLTSLAAESNTFANYKISINFHPDGRVEYPYQIEPGISNQHVALHVLRSQGISHRFLDDALKQLQY